MHKPNTSWLFRWTDSLSATRRNEHGGIWRKAVRGAGLALAALAVAWPLSVAQGQDAAQPMHARVSHDAGGTMIHGAEEDDWAFAPVNTLVLPGDSLWVDEDSTSELEFPHGTFVRMADASQMQVQSIGLTTALEVQAGSFYIQRLARSTGSVVVQTPAATVEIVPDSIIRIDIDDDGLTIVTARQGQTVVRGEHGGGVVVAQGQRAWIDPGLLPSEALAFDSAEADEFDRWHQQRVGGLLQAAAPTTVPREVTIHETTLGVADLAAYGEWVYVDNLPVWRPTVVVDYVPYRYGHWTYVRSVGHVWVGRHPFCHITSHYGTWRYTTRYGWVWSYHGRWSPAWAATIRYGDHYIWTPIDHYHRPVRVHVGATFTVGGVLFSLGATSYAPVTHIHHGPVFVRPATVKVVQNIHVHQTNVHVWNLGPRYRQTVHVPYRGSVTQRIRFDEPARSVRGPSELTRGTHSVQARERVAALTQRSERHREELGNRTRSNGRGDPAWLRTATGNERADRGQRSRPTNLTPRSPDRSADTPPWREQARQAQADRAQENRVQESRAGNRGADRARALADRRATTSGGANDTAHDVRRPDNRVRQPQRPVTASEPHQQPTVREPATRSQPARTPQEAVRRDRLQNLPLFNTPDGTRPSATPSPDPQTRPNVMERSARPAERRPANPGDSRAQARTPSRPQATPPPRQERSETARPTARPQPSTPAIRAVPSPSTPTASDRGGATRANPGQVHVNTRPRASATEPAQPNWLSQMPASRQQGQAQAQAQPSRTANHRANAQANNNRANTNRANANRSNTNQANVNHRASATSAAPPQWLTEAQTARQQRQADRADRDRANNRANTNTTRESRRGSRQ